MAPEGRAALANAIAVERSYTSNTTLATSLGELADAITASNATIVAAITAISGWGE